MKMKYILTIALMLFPALASAQFYVTGDDPGKLKWRYKDTENFRVIYPEGTDSLANVYGSKLEAYRVPVSLTTGYLAGGQGRRRMPVVMHAYNTSNGSVAWAPKRMDLFTIPSAYDPEPLPWSTMLSVHEGRHVTQMQFGMTRAQRPFGWAFGEMWNILVSIVYPGMYFIEGDAVVAETALTRSGRGRVADFLNYYRVAFDASDMRNWNRWLYGSQRHYTPNYYALGYMTLGGIRCFWDEPYFMQKSYDRASRQIWDLTAFETVTRRTSGKNLQRTFAEIADTMKVIWQEETNARAPFMKGEPVTAEPRLYTDYKHNTFIGNDLYAVKSGYLDAPVLVRIDSAGKEHKVTDFASVIGKPEWSPRLERMYWSENVPDERWSMQTHSKIRYMEKGSSRKRTLKTIDLLYNPAPSTSEAYMAVTGYHAEGGSSIGIIDEASGREIAAIEAPDSIQVVETAWIGDGLYATGLSDGGYGIYRVGSMNGTSAIVEWSSVLAPQPVMVKDFRSHDGFLMFTCDRTGADELYHLYPADGRLVQKTSTRYGASDFTYSADGRHLYYSSQTLKGMRIFRIPTDSLLDRTADFTQRHRYPIAEKLAEQEARAQEGKDVSINIKDYPSKKYSKASHMFNVHSWAPVYVSVDNIMNMSFDYIWQAASLGVSGIMQNSLATGVGEFGYSAHKDPYNTSEWRHSAHAKFTYSGLYPIFELAVDFNDRAARQYSTSAYVKDGVAGIEITSRQLPTPYIEGRLSAYIPFNFSSGGWYRGVIPKISYRIGNDMFNTSMAVMSYEPEKGSFYGNPVFIGAMDGSNRFRHSLSGSLRAYSVLSTPNSLVYPEWGIGAEFGASGNLENSGYLSPMGYAYGYGYVPGILDSHGIKLTVMHQQKLHTKAYFGQPAVNVLPRGLNDNTPLLASLSYRNSSMTKLTADYAIPVYIGDVGIIGGFFYIKRLVLTPHFDYTFIGAGGKAGLYSAGANLTLDLNSILWLGWPVQIGVTGTYNGGTGAYSDLNALGSELGVSARRWYFGPTFNVTF